MNRPTKQIASLFVCKMLFTYKLTTHCHTIKINILYTGYQNINAADPAERYFVRFMFSVIIIQSWWSNSMQFSAASKLLIFLTWSIMNLR